MQLWRSPSARRADVAGRSRRRRTQTSCGCLARWWRTEGGDCKGGGLTMMMTVLQHGGCGCDDRQALRRGDGLWHGLPRWRQTEGRGWARADVAVTWRSTCVVRATGFDAGCRGRWRWWGRDKGRQSGTSLSVTNRDGSDWSGFSHAQWMARYIQFDT